MLQHGKLDDSVSRAYYCMLHSAKALLVEWTGKSPKTHAGTIQALGELVRGGLVGRDLFDMIKKAKDIREKGDYSPFFASPRRTAERIASHASSFYREAERLLKKGA
ncbi:MAG: HEPN domain-containing protein [Candidatus Bathyarchaeia archaeon]